MDEARSRGADAVMPRSRFLSTLPNVLQEYAQIPDYEAINEACLEAPSELAIRGLEAFQQGHYFESHEYLEHAWNEDNSAARDVYKAVLQVAVAYLQIERGNYQGAIKMFLRARQWLNPLPDRCRGIDIAQLRVDAQAVHQALLDLGPENLAEFDHAKLKAPTFAVSD
jgi:predicted metal-dependent hydrolase